MEAFAKMASLNEHEVYKFFICCNLWHIYTWKENLLTINMLLPFISSDLKHLWINKCQLLRMNIKFP